MDDKLQEIIDIIGLELMRVREPERALERALNLTRELNLSLTRELERALELELELERARERELERVLELALELDRSES